MARKRVVEPSGVKTWEDANDALRQIAEAQLAVQDIEGEMNKQKQPTHDVHDDTNAD